MNLIWDILLRARSCGVKDQEIFFEQAEWCSPWYEQSFSCLNETDVEPGTVEINMLFRFARIFKELLHKDLTEFPEFQKFLFDAVVHLLAESDLHHGLSKREFYIRKVGQEIASGGFGMSVARGFAAIPSEKRDRLAALALSQIQTGATLFYFRKAVLVLVPNAIADRKQILVYVGTEKAEDLEREAVFLEDMFLPVNYRLRIFWERHFGVIGVDSTMQIGEIEIY